MVFCGAFTYFLTLERVTLAQERQQDYKQLEQ